MEVSARSIYGVSMIGGGANAGIDVTSREGRSVTGYARASFDSMRTTHGLSIAAIYGAGGARWEVVPRLWLGGGARIGHVFVTRVTNRGLMSSVVLGVEGVLVFDVVKIGSSFAMFAFGTPFAELFPLAYGGTVGAGVRW